MKSRVETTNISTADEKDYDGDGVYPIMSTDYVSFSIIHCLARLVFLHSFIPSSVVDYLSNSPFDSYHHLSPNNSQDEALL